MKLEAQKAALDAAGELPVVIKVRIEAEERNEGRRVLLVGAPDDLVRAGVVVAGVGVVQREDDAPLDPRSVHAVAHTIGSHRPAIYVGPDVGVGVEALEAGGDLLPRPLPHGSHGPASQRFYVVLRIQSDRRSQTNDREMLTGGIRRCSGGSCAVLRATAEWPRQPCTLCREVETNPV